MQTDLQPLHEVVSSNSAQRSSSRIYTTPLKSSRLLNKVEVLKCVN